jgi:cyanophycinase
MRRALLLFVLLTLGQFFNELVIYASVDRFDSDGRIILCADDIPSSRIIDELASGTDDMNRWIAIIETGDDRERQASSLRGEPFDARLLRLHPRIKIIKIGPRFNWSSANIEWLQSIRVACISGATLESLLPIAENSRIVQFLTGIYQRGGTIAAFGNASLILSRVIFLENSGYSAKDHEPPRASIYTISKDSITPKKGIGLITNFFIDRNSIERSRLNHLVNGVLYDPTNIGIGIDRHSEVLIKRDGDMEVIGAANVIIVDASEVLGRGNEPAATVGEKFGQIRAHLLLPGGIYNLNTRKVKLIGNKPISGNLIIAGGGTLPDDILDKFIELAGGPESSILILSAGLDTREKQQQEYNVIRELLGKRGCKNVKPLFLQSTEDAQAPELSRLVHAAQGIMLGGGDQNRIARVIQGTAIETAIRERYARGAVISGVSAGAAIQGRIMITGNMKHMPEDQTLPSPWHTLRVGEVELAPGLNFVPGVIIDQHFLARARGNRLLSAILQYNSLIGIGIDAGAGIWVKPNHTFEVLGDSGVMVIDTISAQIVEGWPIEGMPNIWTVGAQSLRLHYLEPGEAFDLMSGKPIRSKKK